MAGKEVINREINGKSLIMQLFREHEIPVPLKTQGWIINSLHSIRYDPQIGEWNYRYFKGSRNSTKCLTCFPNCPLRFRPDSSLKNMGRPRRTALYWTVRKNRIWNCKSGF